MVSLLEHPAEPTTSNAAFTRIFESEFDYIWASLRRLGVDERDVEDVAHDVFLQVYLKFGAYDPERPARPWLFGFAFRAASDYRRLARHRVEVIRENLEEDHDRAVAVPHAEEALCRVEEAQLVSEALESIDLDQRAVLIAYELDECPMKEIADALEIPLQTAYSRLRAARQQFAAAVRRCRVRRGDP